MNVMSHKTLQQMIEVKQNDHPIGSIAQRYADQAIKRTIPNDKKPKRVRKLSTKKHKVNANSCSPIKHQRNFSS